MRDQVWWGKFCFKPIKLGVAAESCGSGMYVCLLPWLVAQIRPVLGLTRAGDDLKCSAFPLQGLVSRKLAEGLFLAQRKWPHPHWLSHQNGKQGRIWKP